MAVNCLQVDACSYPGFVYTLHHIKIGELVFLQVTQRTEVNRDGIITVMKNHVIEFEK